VIGRPTLETPVRVAQVDVRAPVDLHGPAGGRALLVFWRGDHPLGQAETLFGAAGQLHASDIAALVPPIEPPYPSSTGTLPRCSLVICTRDRPEELERCLNSLGTQSHRPDEVIVVDNAPTDERTWHVAQMAGATYVREDRPGLDVARNAGARATQHAIIAYTDDDVVLHPRWLERLASAFDAPDIMAVTGLVLPAELETEAQQIFERHWGFGRGYQRFDFGREFFAATRALGCPAWHIGAGASMAFRREAFEHVGYFDERLDAGAAGCSGDSEFWHRLLAAGWRCRYEPSSVAFHYHRRSLDALASQIRFYARGHVAALLVQYERTRERGNLRRIWSTLPHHYAYQFCKRLRHGRAPENYFLGEEVRGTLSGIVYYLATPRPAAR